MAGIVIRAVLLLAVFTCSVDAQVEGQPLLTIDRVVSHFLELNASERIDTPEGRTLLTGEALAIFTTPSIGPLPRIVDRVIVVDATHAVARVCAQTPKRVVDTYFHLEKTSTWQISAFRVLSQTGLIESALASVSTTRPLTPDEARQVANMKLTLESDAGLRAWFTGHRASLDALVKSAQAQLKTGEVATDSNGRSPNLSTQLRELALSSVSITDEGNVEVAIGGITDNVVMFIFSPRSTPPRMTPQEYIWVEPLEGKWYLAKTT